MELLKIASSPAVAKFNFKWIRFAARFNGSLLKDENPADSLQILKIG